MKIKGQLSIPFTSGKTKALLPLLTMLVLCLLLTEVSVESSGGHKRKHKPAKDSTAQENSNGASTDESKAAETSPQVNHGDDKTVGWIEVDLPDRVKLGKQYDIDIWLHPSDPSYTGTVKVYMEQTDRVQYDPRVFDLKTGERKIIKAQVTATEAGLAVIRATADGWDDLSISLDAGFSAKLQAEN